jgi:hypothetical protein
MDTSQLNKQNGLDTLFPTGRDVKIPLPPGSERDRLISENKEPVEILHIMPLPFLKWRDGFLYIVRIAPLLGFDLNMSPEDWESRAQNLVENGGNPDIIEVDKSLVLSALTGDSGKMIYEFLAFAIDKPVTYFNQVYAEAIDIAMAVIEVNVNFFVQWLLPKIVSGSKELGQIINQAKRMAAPVN